MRIAVFAALAVAAAVSGLLGSCATSSGSTYSSAESSEKAARAKKPPETAKPSPPDAASASPRDQGPRPERNDRRDDGGGATFFLAAPGIEEKAPTGSLVIENLAPGSRVYVDDDYRDGPSIELSLGAHELRVARFGYRDFETAVSIDRYRVTTARVEYERAPFAIRNLEVGPRAFDPADPGSLGSCGATVTVDAEGSGSAFVLDESGRRLRSLGRLAFTGPELRLRWDGRDDGGAVLPPGDYLIRVEGEGAGGETDSAAAKVSLVQGLYARSTSLYSGVSGALFAPDARGLDTGRFETSAGGELHLSPAGGSISGLGTVHAGLRFGLPSSSGASELDFSLMTVLWQDDPSIDSYSATGAWKYSLSAPSTPAAKASPFAAAVYVKATLARFLSGSAEDTATPSWDGTTRYSGFSAGMPLEYDSGIARAFATPEIEVSDYYPNWAATTGSGAEWTTPGLFAWAYLRLGVEATTGAYSIAFSTALRSSPFGAPIALAGPYPLGLEVRWHAASSPLVLSFMATGEFEDLGDYYLGAGLGMGLRY